MILKLALCQISSKPTHTGLLFSSNYFTLFLKTLGRYFCNSYICV